MKKIFISVLILITCSLYAQNKSNTPSLTDFYFIYGSDWYLRGGEITGHHENLDTDLYAVYDADNGNKISKMSLLIDENGFVQLMNEDCFTTIIGKNIGYALLENNFTEKDFVLTNYIKSISSDNFLTEKIGGKTVEYKAENLLQSATWGGLESPYVYNCQTTPFVPANNGKNGIGTKITVNLKKAQKKIQILGGYVDPMRHPDYYLKNCRPKTIKIKDLNSDYSLICDLKDLPVYQSFDFEKPLTDFEIEILDIYKGSKYSDLCISGLLF